MQPKFKLSFIENIMHIGDCKNNLFLNVQTKSLNTQLKKEWKENKMLNCDHMIKPLLYTSITKNLKV
jgi:hypothetical protein